MSIILPEDTKINPESLSIDFYLEATRIDGTKKNISGLETYTIEKYTENKGYGITSVDIDVKPNLQPIVNITFKDFYGNTAFNSSGQGLDILFDIPYPKFRLYVRGFVGLPVSFLLQVKSIKTTYQANDGSYEIKGEFVPNIFGFFNDIPYQFLFAVPKLRNEGQSIVQLAKNGVKVQQQIQSVADKYSDLTNKLNILNNSPDAIAQAYLADRNNFLNPLESSDQDLINNGWTNIKFSIDTTNAKGIKIESIPVENNTQSIYGNSILSSINYKDRVIWKNGTSKVQSFIETQEGKDQIANAKVLIQKNLEAIQKTTQTVGIQSVETEVIDSVTIQNVMKTLASDCAYILGYILEGGLNGFNANQTNRINSKKLYGRYYPLEDVTTNQAINEQIPASEAVSEKDKVRKFVKALWEGTKEATEVIDYVQNAINGNPSATDSGPLKKRITNAEFTRQNPYGATTQDGDLFIVNILQRAGLMSVGYAGPRSKTKSLVIPTSAEAENLKEVVLNLRGTEREKLKTFCENWLNLCDMDGKFKNNLSFSSATKSDATVSYQKYLSGYLAKFKCATWFGFVE